MASIVQVHLSFGMHGDGTDVAAIRPSLESCHVYVPEMSGWNLEVLDIYQMLADGEINEDGALLMLADMGDRPSPFRYAELGMIAGSGRSIMFLDTPQGHPLAVLLAQHYGMLRETFRSGDTFARAMPRVRELLTDIGRAHRERERHMVKQFWPEVANLHLRRPALRDVSPVRMLIRLGSGHTAVARGLRSAGVPVTRSLQRHPESFCPEEEAVRCAAFGRPVSDTLMAGVMLARLCQIRLGWPNSDATTDEFERFHAFTRRAMTRFSVAEIAVLWDLAGSAVKPAELIRHELGIRGLFVP